MGKTKENISVRPDLDQTDVVHRTSVTYVGIFRLHSYAELDYCPRPVTPIYILYKRFRIEQSYI